MANFWLKLFVRIFKKFCFVLIAPSRSLLSCQICYKQLLRICRYLFRLLKECFSPLYCLYCSPLVVNVCSLHTSFFSYNQIFSNKVLSISRSILKYFLLEYKIQWRTWNIPLCCPQCVLYSHLVDHCSLFNNFEIFFNKILAHLEIF